MGANLSSTEKVDTSVDVIGAQDAISEKVLLVFWASCFYVMFMIWSTTLLVDRWRGPVGSDKGRPTSFASVLAAFVMSVAWPVVFVYLFMNQ